MKFITETLPMDSYFEANKYFILFYLPNITIIRIIVKISYALILFPNR